MPAGGKMGFNASLSQIRYQMTKLSEVKLKN
jgi:hypothetical protein